MAEVYFFGCVGHAGHHLWAPSTLGCSAAEVDEDGIDGWPWRWGELDGKYAPGGEHKDKLGPATITHHEGWTVLAMWDRSVDTRPGSNAAFVARGEQDFATMMRLARERFRAVFMRIWAQAPLMLVRRDTRAAR